MTVPSSTRVNLTLWIQRDNRVKCEKSAWILGLGRFGVRLLHLWILLAMPVVVQAQFLYTTAGGQITITEYIGAGGAASIPATINGLPVIRIADSAFQYQSSLTSVTIPNSVTSIGGYTFYGCTGLTNVTIGNSVKSIGYDAFYGCSGLQGVYFLGNPPSLGADAFIGATAATVYFNPGTKGWTDRFGGRPTKMWDQQPQPRATNLGFKSGQFGFDITAMSGQPFVIEAATNLVQPVWKPLSTNTAINTVSFTDPQWKEYPTRLYRIRTP